MDRLEPKRHFSHFKMMDVSESVNQPRSCVWIAVVGELWKQRNKKIFKSCRIDHIEVFMIVQLKV